MLEYNVDYYNKQGDIRINVHREAQYPTLCECLKRSWHASRSFRVLDQSVLRRAPVAEEIFSRVFLGTFYFSGLPVMSE